MYIIAVDANLCFNGATVKGGLYSGDWIRVDTLRAHQNDTDYRAIFQFEYVDEYIDEELGVVAQYIIRLPQYGISAALEVDSSLGLVVKESLFDPEEVPGEPFAMEYVQ